MPKTHTPLSETHTLGAQTRQWVVRASSADPRARLQDAPVCPALTSHQTAHLGVCHAVAPYRTGSDWLRRHWPNLMTNTELGRL
jgi:bifunctional pyridoxal-dependent enzyme with beta-cystathionase and maltose regulon repressor activities